MTETYEQSLVNNEEASEVVFAYHERTKHHFNRYARSLGHMDWANQPNPFRFYEGALQTKLNAHRQPRPLPYDRLYEKGNAPPQPLDLESLSDFFRYSLAISAWKQYGSSRWALRINPSSGNLHPTEAYVLLPPVSGIRESPTLCHYVSQLHVLEQRATHREEVWQYLMNLFPEGSFLLGLSSILWREAWKYGERAFRYCQHDIGHAVAALGFSAVLCGWNFHLVSDWSTDDVALLLGVDREDNFHEGEHEEAEVLAVVTPQTGVATNLPSLPIPNETIRREISEADWHGKSNRLSKSNVAWPVIEEVAAATRMPGIPAPVDSTKIHNDLLGFTRDLSTSDSEQIILQRRSCQTLDGASTMTRKAFLSMLARTLPGSHPPWNALYWRPRIHLLLFVHRVVGMRPGVYVLVRDLSKTDLLKSAWSAEFSWETPDDLSTEFPLFLLLEGDCRQTARSLSCHQDIAADGFFSLGMIADFSATIKEHGAPFYRNLFWETGVIGQVLYLEAEAAGARSTGIGCFFDDPVHDILGLEGNRFQSLYHFTVGMPVEDHRIQSSPAYPE